MRYIAFILIYFSSTLFLSAQEVEEVDYLQLNEMEMSEIGYVDSTVLKPEAKKLDFGVEVGMGYSFSSGGYNGPQFYFSPHATYKLSDKVSLIGGAGIGYNQTVWSYSPISEQFSLLPMTNIYLYGGVSYSLNPKLEVYAAAEVSVFEVTNSSNVTTTETKTSYGTTVGFQYKISSNVSFGAQIRIQDGFNSSPFAPYRNPAGEYNPNWW